MVMHLCIPISDEGNPHQKATNQVIPQLQEINGETIIQRILSSFPKEWPTHFIITETYKNTGLEEHLRDLRPRGTIQYMSSHNRGPAWTLSPLLPSLPDNDSIFVSYSDYSKIWDAKAFERFVNNTECDVCIPSYRGFHPLQRSRHTAYSDISNDRVTDIIDRNFDNDGFEEKFSSSGGFYFKKIGLLRRAIERQIIDDIHDDGAYHFSLTIKSLMKNADVDVRIFEVPYFFQLATPESIESFAYHERTFKAACLYPGKEMLMEQVLIPMADNQAEFKTIFDTPQPFIPIRGTPMYRKAMETLPQGGKKSIVALDYMEKHFQDGDDPVNFLPGPKPQELGSIVSGLAALDLNRPVLISGYDHGIALAPSVWKKFLTINCVDGAVFTIKGYPIAQDELNAYSYAQTDEDGSDFPIVKNISEKSTSKKPLHQKLVVGTYWFRSVKLLKQYINGVDLADSSLHGVIHQMIADKLNIVSLPLDGFINWKTPKALAESLYWEELFYGQRTRIRSKFEGCGSITSALP